MDEKKFLLHKTPTVGDAIDLYGFICPSLKMLPYDVYLRLEVADSGLILESEKHYFDNVYNLSQKRGPNAWEEIGPDYVASLTGSRGYPIDAEGLLKSRQQLKDAGLLRKRAVNAFMSRYSKSPILRNSFDSDLRWEQNNYGDMILILTSSSEGDFKRLEKRLLQQFEMEELGKEYSE